MENNKKMYWIECEEGLEGLKLLYENGYSFGSYVVQSVLTDSLKQGFAVVIVVDFDNKNIGFFPLEIYPEGSEKFKYFFDKCSFINDLKNDLKEEV